MCSVHSSTIHLGIAQSAGILSDSKGDHDEEKDFEKKESEERIDAITRYSMGRSYSPRLLEPKHGDTDDEKNTLPAVIESQPEETPNTTDHAIDKRSCSCHDCHCDTEMIESKDPVLRRQPLTATTSYIGETDDNQWWQGVPVPHNLSPKTHSHLCPHHWMHPKLSEEQEAIERKNENQEIYQKLLDGMDTFRYQNA